MMVETGRASRPWKSMHFESANDRILQDKERVPTLVTMLDKPKCLAVIVHIPLSI